LTGEDNLPFFIIIVALSVLLIGVVGYFIVMPKLKSSSENGLDDSLMGNDKA
jgi:hypothetical protein